MFNLISYESIRKKPGSCGNSEGAFGPCLIMSRADYIKAGGHEADPPTVVEDLRLARRLLRRGVPVRCFNGKGLIEYRMYSSLRGLIEGFSKNLVFGFSSASMASVILAIVWMSSFLSPFIRLLSSPMGPMLIAQSAALAVSFFGSLYLFTKLGRVSRLYPLLFFLIGPFFVLVFAISLTRTLLLKKITWKGRTIRV
jgi:4,4'-diaponeurosporenoate glycosyltransferase